MVDRYTAGWLRAVQRAAKVPNRVPLQPGVHIDGGIATLATLKARSFNFDTAMTDPDGALRIAAALVFRSPIGGQELDANGNPRCRDTGSSSWHPGGMHGQVRRGLEAHKAHVEASAKLAAKERRKRAIENARTHEHTATVQQLETTIAILRNNLDAAESRLRRTEAAAAEPEKNHE